MHVRKVKKEKKENTKPSFSPISGYIDDMGKFYSSIEEAENAVNARMVEKVCDQMWKNYQFHSEDDLYIESSKGLASFLTFKGNKELLPRLAELLDERPAS